MKSFERLFDGTGWVLRRAADARLRVKCEHTIHLSWRSYPADQVSTERRRAVCLLDYHAKYERCNEH